MTEITREITINAPRDQVWEALANFGNIVTFNINLIDSRLLGEQSEGVGTRRHCDMDARTGFDERVTRWEDGRGYTVEMHNFKGMPPMNHAHAAVDVRDAAAPGQSVVTFSLDYELGMGVLGAVMDAAMAKRQFQTNADRFLQGLKYHVETGQKSTLREVKRYIKASA